VTAANVVFWTQDFDPAKSGEEQIFGFDCPKRKSSQCAGLVIAGRTDLKRDPNGKNGGTAQWDWDGNREAPTFMPSINCMSCWHGYIRNGRCVDTHGDDEPQL
jgi:Family of unknown function (DUF6527)